MTNEANMPELRFPGFNGKWEIKKLKDIGDIITGKTPSTSNPKFYNGNYPFVSPLDIQNHRFIKKTNKTLSEKGFYSGRIIRKGASLFVCIGSTIGKIGQAGTDVITNQQINSLIPYERYDDNFIYSNLLKSSSKIKQLAATQALPIINKETFGSYFINLPQLDEQIKIGNFFNKLDRQIELEEEKLELLEQQKRGYMQKIFSQELRFKDDNGNSYPDWSIKKIEDISKVNKGFTPNTKNDEYWDELNENWLSIAGMTQKYLYKGNKGITEKGASKHVKVDKDTLIMSFKLTLGKLAIVKEPIYTNEAICHFVWKESNVNTEYMYYYLNSINISTFGAQAVKGVTLNNDSINSIIVKLPVIQEQNKIAYFFNELDKLIRKQYAKIEVLKQRKKGLLQKMFI